MARQIVVDLIADSSKFTKGTRDATNAAATFSDKVKSSVLTGVGLGAGIGAWGLLSDAVGKAADAVQASVQAASDQREAMALSEQVFKTSAADVDRFASSTTDAFSKTEALTYAAKFGTAFQSVGMALDETTDKSEALVTLAGDLASAFNTSAKEAGDSLRSGLMGEAEPMRKFGVFLSEAAVSAKAASLGFKAVGGSLSDSQKIAARYAIIMEQTADSQGMFGRDSESLADKQKLLAANVEDLSARFGSLLTPAMNTATMSALDLLDAFDRLDQGSPVDMLAALGDAYGRIVNPAAVFREQLDQTAVRESAVAAATGAMATSFVLNSASMTTALGKVDTSVGRTADKVWTATSQMRRDWAAYATDFLLGEYTADMNRAFDIQDARVGISAAATERAALRKELAEGHLTKVATAEANARMVVLDLETAAHYARLAEMGALSEADMEAWGAVLNRLGKTTDAEFKRSIDDAQAHYDAFRKHVQKPVTVTVVYKQKVTGSNDNPTHYGDTDVKSAGGNTFPLGGLSWVGEQGKELVYVPPGGQVFSNADSMRIAGGGAPARAAGPAVGGGGVTVNVYGHIVGPSGVDELMDMMATRLRLDGK